ncbi:MT-A70-domain-containing protein [Pavlovales sp. CCMP2436]|nr:MT-A70-domain-containing protein [Pavlovales sp. CCMP2436]|mmetsp:Transcript_33445/g.83224  ORF Transcript_33445/g.83224 Transcript_33445/m.83224 type:complete len:422 (+) Transcript_33445:13-1278(+)
MADCREMLPAPRDEAAPWAFDVIDQVHARAGRCVAILRPLLRPYTYGVQGDPSLAGRKRPRSARAKRQAGGALETITVVENEPGLCDAIGRTHQAFLRAGARALLHTRTCSCGEAPGDGLDLLAELRNGGWQEEGDTPEEAGSAGGAQGALLQELRVDYTSDEIGVQLLRQRWVSNAAQCARWLRAFGQRWQLPASSTCLLSEMRGWAAPLQLMRPAGGFELVVIDPPWPSLSAKRARAYETAADIRTSLPAQVPLRELLSAETGALVCVWCTNRKAFSDWIVETLFPGWGLRHIATWYWLKVAVECGALATGPVDSPHRKPWEPLLIGVAGNPHWVRGFPQRLVVCAPPVGHSVKPPLEALLRKHASSGSTTTSSSAPGRPLFAPGSKLELFARELHPGWCSAGNQTLLFQGEGWFCRAV